ncbi:Neuromedin-U receptor 2, partial [Stegodyphus mimosarum]
MNEVEDVVVATLNASWINCSNGTSAEEDMEELVRNTLGPKRLPLNWLIPLTFVYSVIFLTGIVGNVCTCLVIARNQYMQTATNCYLFNLAIADMMTLIFDTFKWIRHFSIAEGWIFNPLKVS